MAHWPIIATFPRLIAAAGLLPQLCAMLLVATGVDRALGGLVAFAYGMLIASFIGGIWWGFAMRAESSQGRFGMVAVAPTLVVFILAVARLSGFRSDWALIVLGLVIIAMLAVDRRFVAEDLAPPGWMGLRVPLAIGLGALTIVTGMLAPARIALIYSG